MQENAGIVIMRRVAPILVQIDMLITVSILCMHCNPERPVFQLIRVHPTFFVYRNISLVTRRDVYA